MAGCRLDPQIFNLEILMDTEREFVENVQALPFSQKLKDRATNLARNAFKLYRGITIADMLVQRRKQREAAREAAKEAAEQRQAETNQLEVPS